MKKFFILSLVFLLPFLTKAQYFVSVQSNMTGTDSTYEWYCINSPTSTYGNRITIGKLKANQWVNWVSPRFIIKSIASTSISTGNPLCIASITDSGTIHMTKLDSIILKQAQILGLPDSLNIRYTKSQSDLRYLQSFTEVDPVYAASVASGITSTLVSHWTTSYNLALTALQSYTETDPIWIAASVNYFNKTASDTRYLQSFTEIDPIYAADSAGLLKKAAAILLYQPKGTYVTTEVDPVFGASVASGITSTNVSNWNAAYPNSNPSNFISNLSTFTTSNLTEGTNLYLTTARVNAIAPTLVGTGATGTWSIGITGNSATSTNGVVTTGGYSNPAWITTLDNSKIIGLGSAALTSSTSYATTVQGTTADNALQPSGNGSSLTGLTKTQVSLANVDNTSDVNKPVSTAQAVAIALKYTIPTGTTSQYIRGDGTLVTFPTIPTTPTIHNAVARPINSTTFTISANQANVSYYVKITCTASIGSASIGTVVFQYSTDSGTTWQELGELTNSNTVTLALTLNAITIQTGCISGNIPSGALCRMNSTSSGTTSIAYITGNEMY